jgi:hypothetical protein
MRSRTAQQIAVVSSVAGGACRMRSEIPLPDFQIVWSITVIQAALVWLATTAAMVLTLVATHWKLENAELTPIKPCVPDRAF